MKLPDLNTVCPLSVPDRGRTDPGHPSDACPRIGRRRAGVPLRVPRAAGMHPAMAELPIAVRGVRSREHRGAVAGRAALRRHHGGAPGLSDADLAPDTRDLRFTGPISSVATPAGCHAGTDCASPRSYEPARRTAGAQVIRGGRSGTSCRASSRRTARRRCLPAHPVRRGGRGVRRSCERPQGGPGLSERRWVGARPPSPVQGNPASGRMAQRSRLP